MDGEWADAQALYLYQVRRPVAVPERSQLGVDGAQGVLGQGVDREVVEQAGRPAVAGGVLYVSTEKTLYAIGRR